MRTAWTIDGRTYHLHAWTGGEAPSDLPLAWRSARRRIRGELYREQWRDWVQYWGDTPNAAVRDTFWRRADADAYRTVTEYWRTRAA